MPLPSTQDSFEILGKLVKLATFHCFLMILIREIEQIGDSSSLSKVCVCQDYGKQMFGCFGATCEVVMYNAYSFIALSSAPLALVFGFSSISLSFHGKCLSTESRFFGTDIS